MTVTVIVAAICFVALILIEVFGNRIGAALDRRKQQKVLRRENAKPVIIMNSATHPKVGKMLVVVWGSDFFRFAVQQEEKGSQGMYYAPRNMPACVFTASGYMPDGSPATGTIYQWDNAFQFYLTQVRVENRPDLFIPQLNEKYTSLEWQKFNCGIIPPSQWEVYGFFSRVFRKDA